MQFSIAVPVCRQAQFLPTAMDSIRVQKRPFQLAVMDATPDGSVQAVLESYQDILSYRRYGPDLGQSAAIQEGWEHTDGDIVAWLCADDYYFPYTFEEVEKIFIDRPDIDVVYGDGVFVNDAGHFIRYFPEISEDISLITRGCCILQPSCFVRREALNKIGRLNKDLHYIMDWDLWTRLYKAKATFFYLKKPLSVVRIYQDTKTSSRSNARYAEIYTHLRMNTGFFSGMRAMVGFYYQDLLARRTSLSDTILFGGINLCRSIKRLFCKQAQAEKKSFYGLERLLNQVDDECEVILPWYSSLPPVEAIIKFKDIDSPDVYINGHKEDTILLPEVDDNKVCSAGIQNYVGGLVAIRLSSPNQKPWHLTSICLT